MGVSAATIDPDEIYMERSQGYSGSYSYIFYINNDVCSHVTSVFAPKDKNHLY